MNLKTSLVNAALSILCGFIGAGFAIYAFGGQLEGAAGPRGFPGPAGPPGPSGPAGASVRAMTPSDLFLKNDGVSVEFAIDTHQQAIATLSRRVAALEAKPTLTCAMRSDVVTGVSVGLGGDLNVSKKYGVCLPQ